MLRFAGLSHQVRDIDARGAGFVDRFGNSFHQKIRNDAGVERDRADQNQVRLGESLPALRAAGERVRGTSRTRTMRWREREILVSPFTIVPFSSSASSVTFCAVEGKIRPRMASTRDETRTASAKSPVTLVSAVTNRLPKAVSREPAPAGNGTETVCPADARLSKAPPCNCECRPEAARDIRAAGGRNCRRRR